MKTRLCLLVVLAMAVACSSSPEPKPQPKPDRPAKQEQQPEQAPDKAPDSQPAEEVKELPARADLAGRWTRDDGAAFDFSYDKDAEVFSGVLVDLDDSDYEKYNVELRWDDDNNLVGEAKWLELDAETETPRVTRWRLNNPLAEKPELKEAKEIAVQGELESVAIDDETFEPVAAGFEPKSFTVALTTPLTTVEEPKPEEPMVVTDKPSVKKPEMGDGDNVNQPKPEEPKAEEPKPEEPKAEEPKPTDTDPVEPANPEEPKPEEPKPEEPMVVTDKPEVKKPEMGDGDNSNEPKPEEPKAEEPKPEEPKPSEPMPAKNEPAETNGTNEPDTVVTENSNPTDKTEESTPDAAVTPPEPEEDPVFIAQVVGYDGRIARGKLFQYAMGVAVVTADGEEKFETHEVAAVSQVKARNAERDLVMATAPEWKIERVKKLSRRQRAVMERQKRLAAEAEKMAAENEKMAAEKAEAERMAAEKAAAEKAEAEAMAAKKAEEERMAAEKAEAEAMAAKKAEEERMAAEKAEAEKMAAAKAEEERMAAEKAEAEAMAAKKAEEERMAAEKAEAERLAAEKAAAMINAENVTVLALFDGRVLRGQLFFVDAKVAFVTTEGTEWLDRSEIASISQSPATAEEQALRSARKPALDKPADSAVVEPAEENRSNEEMNKPADTEPATTEPEKTEEKTEPVTTEPETTEPATTEPEKTEPEKTDETMPKGPEPIVVDSSSPEKLYESLGKLMVRGEYDRVRELLANEADCNSLLGAKGPLLLKKVNSDYEKDLQRIETQFADLSTATESSAQAGKLRSLAKGKGGTARASEQVKVGALTYTVNGESKVLRFGAIVKTDSGEWRVLRLLHKKQVKK